MMREWRGFGGFCKHWSGDAFSLLIVVYVVLCATRGASIG